MHLRTALVAPVVALVALVAGLAALPANAVTSDGATVGAATPRLLPPTGVDFDYQLGGARAVPKRVGIVVRDRAASPAAGRYNVCYVNGFQTQAEEKRFWRRHWSLVLKQDGKPVVDSGWGEWLLDIRTDAKRRKLARIVGALDRRLRRRRLRRGRARQPRLVQPEQGSSPVTTRALRGQAGPSRPPRGPRRGPEELAARRHPDRLRLRDRGGVRPLARVRRLRRHYGSRVLGVEYRRRDFRRACRNWSDELAVVRRDVALSTHGVRKWCSAHR